LRLPTWRGEEVRRRFVLEVGAGSHPLVHGTSLPEVVRRAVKMCKVTDTDTVWHLFCGGGEMTLGLGAVCERVVAIGTSASEVAELKRNLAANNVENTTSVLCNLRSPWTLRQLAFHVTQSQQKRLLLGTGEEQEKAREFALSCFVPGEGRRRQLQRLSAAPFTAPLLRQDAMAYRELQVLLPAFVRDFKPSQTTLPVPSRSPQEQDGPKKGREVPEEMEGRLKALYRRLALKYHPDRNPFDPDASERFQALTQAYRALVGDSAGPEEGDEVVKDPFVTAHHSTFRPKFKNSWRGDQPKRQRAQSIDEAEDADEQAGEPDDDAPWPPRDDPAAEDSMPRLSSVHARAQSKPRWSTEHAGAAGADDFDFEGELPDKPKRLASRRDDSEDEIAIPIEIDESWARPADRLPKQTEAVEEAPREVDTRPELVLREPASDKLSANQQPMQVATLPPPDVIVVTQPKPRKHGQGSKRYFHHWLRSTAARAIIYISTDVDAFQVELKSLMGLGYGLVDLQPFDPEPHRRGVLLVARLELLRPLHGSGDYADPGSDRLISGSLAMLPGGPDRPLLGGGGYSASSAAGGSRLKLLR